MDAFLTPGQKALRQRIRAHFLGADPGAADLLGGLGLGPAGATGFLERALAIEEISAVSPSLGRSFAEGDGGWDAGSGVGKTITTIARSLGTAAATLEACLRAAREKGLFESVLMDHQKVQSELAEIHSELEAARLLAYRAFLLLDRGDTARGERELEPASARAFRVSSAARSLASALLGPEWLERNPDETERSRT
jgi:hypothetical protein